MIGGLTQSLQTRFCLAPFNYFKKIFMPAYKVASLLLIVAIMVLSTGCVKSTTGGYRPNVTDAKVVNQRLQAARSYIAAGNWEGAKRHLSAAAKLDHNNPEVFETLAVVMQNTGEYELAERNFKKALRINPKYSRGLNNYAAFLYQQQRYPEACTQLELLVADVLYEKRQNAFINLGRCYSELQQYVRAEKAYERALMMNQGDPISLFELADINYKLQQYKKSINYYKAYKGKVRQQSPRSLWLGVKLARYTGNKNDEASYGLVLKNLYPDSKEYEMFQRLSQQR
jgi:type IV pilus assembly protein PilF